MGEANESRSFGGNRCNYKVGRVLEEYDLAELDAALVDMWLDDRPGESYSLRELSEHINQRLLRTAMERAGIDPIDGETDETYRLLRAEDINEDVRRKAIHRLERERVDVDGLTEDFVTHQAVHTYLTEFREVGRDTDDPGEVRTRQELMDELTDIATESLESARDAGELDLGSFDLDLELRVYCEECEGTYSLAELFGKGGCSCETLVRK